MEDFDFIEQLLNSSVANRLADAYTKDEEYQNRLKEEDLIYRKLSDGLSDPQAEELEQYFEAASSTLERQEMLTYIQGMKDVRALLKKLSEN